MAFVKLVVEKSLSFRDIDQSLWKSFLISWVFFFCFKQKLTEQSKGKCCFLDQLSGLCSRARMDFCSRQRVEVGQIRCWNRWWCQRSFWMFQPFHNPRLQFRLHTFPTCFQYNTSTEWRIANKLRPAVISLCNWMFLASLPHWGSRNEQSECRTRVKDSDRSTLGSPRILDCC